MPVCKKDRFIRDCETARLREIIWDALRCVKPRVYFLIKLLIIAALQQPYRHKACSMHYFHLKNKRDALFLINRRERKGFGNSFHINAIPPPLYPPRS